MEGTLVDRNNTLYVMLEDTAYSAPILRRLYYPLNYQGTAHRFTRDYGDKIGQKLRYDRTMRAYQDDTGLWYYLRDGGDTRPSFVEETPLPCPKVRRGTEVRYEAGRWQKYLKREGWVPA